MLNCKISKPINPICETSVSGVLKIWAANWNEAHTFTASGDDCLIDIIELADGEKFIPIDFQDNSGYANANLAAGGSTDSKAIAHQVGFVINRINCDLLGDWKNWLLGRLIFAVMTKNKQIIIFGVDNGMQSTNFDFATGTAEADLQGVTVLFEGNQHDAPLLVKDQEVIRALVAEP